MRGVKLYWGVYKSRLLEFESLYLNKLYILSFAALSIISLYFRIPIPVFFTHNWKMSLIACSVHEFRSIVAEKSKMSQPISGQGGHLGIFNQPKNTNYVEDAWFLLPVKFPWIPFSSCREEDKNGSANQRPVWSSCFSDRPEKHKLVRGYWDLASCQISWNYVY